MADTGIGIAEADLPRLGDPFFQAGSAYSRSHEGTGLGLSVVRGLVGLHQGELTIESADGDGTAVTVSLPIDCRGGTPRQPCERARGRAPPGDGQPAQDGGEITCARLWPPARAAIS